MLQKLRKHYFLKVLGFGWSAPRENPSDSFSGCSHVFCSHPRVAKFICKKLIRRFVSDRPDQALIDSAAAVFRANWQHPNQIRITLRHILLSNAFKNSWGQKNRRPFEMVAAALRSVSSTWTIRRPSWAASSG